MDFKEKRPVSLDKSKIECYNCHRKGHFARECRSGRSQGRRPYGDRSNAQTTESSSQALVAQDGLGGYDWSNDFEVEPINYAMLAITHQPSKSSDEESTLANNKFTKASTTNEPTIVKPKSVNETVVSKSKINRDEVIIEDWTSDDEDDVCADKTVSSIKPNVTQAVRSQADKSGQTLQKQGIGFKKVHKIKACFVCKSTGHLIKDCDFYDQKSPEPRVMNVVNTGKRVVKPVYGKRVNHHNFSKNLKYPHAKRTFNPSTVLTGVGLVNTDRSNVSTARSISTVRPVSTARPLSSKIAQSNSVIRPNHPRLDI
ncbi:ribonuclease H-like domain-containing protein, partial [Tanacetum coccineum]